MFQIDEFVVHPTGGICKIEKIDLLEIAGADQTRQYYYLIPNKSQTGKVYVPVDLADNVIRKVMTDNEAKALIEDIPTINPTIIDNEKIRELKYKEAIKSCDCRQLVGVIKNLHMRKIKRIEEGKKNTATDEKYSKIAEENLYSELAFAIGAEKKQMQEVVMNRIEIQL